MLGKITNNKFKEINIFYTLANIMVILRTSSKTAASDQELVQKYKKTGDKQIIAELFNRYSSFVLAICMKYLRDKILSEEMTVEIFESLIKKLKKQDTQYFKTWLYTISKNHCLMYLRKSGSRLRNEDDYKNDTENFVDFHDEMNQKNKEENDYEKIKKALNQLKSEQKRCLELFYFEEKSYTDIVELTGYSLKKVKSYLQNGKRNLKLKLEKEYEQE